MKRMNEAQRRKQLIPIKIVIVLVFLIAVAGTGKYIIGKYIPSKERMDLTEYYGEEAFPRAGEMYFHGTDSNGPDCTTDQAERA